MKVKRAIPRNNISLQSRVTTLVKRFRRLLILLILFAVFVSPFIIVYSYSFSNVNVVYHGAISEECVNKEKIVLETKNESALNLLVGTFRSRFIAEYNCIANIRYYPESINKVRVELTSYEPVLAVILSRVETQTNPVDSYNFFGLPVAEESVRYARVDGELIDFSKSLPLPRIFYRSQKEFEFMKSTFTQEAVKFLITLSNYFEASSGSSPRIEVSEHHVVRVSSSDVAAVFFSLERDLESQLKLYKTVIDFERSLGRNPTRIDVRYRDPIVM